MNIAFYDATEYPGYSELQFLVTNDSAPDHVYKVNVSTHYTRRNELVAGDVYRDSSRAVTGWVKLPHSDFERLIQAKAKGLVESGYVRIRSDD